MKENKVHLHIQSAQKYTDSGKFQKAIDHSRRALELQFGVGSLQKLFAKLKDQNLPDLTQPTMMSPQQDSSPRLPSVKHTRSVSLSPPSQLNPPLLPHERYNQRQKTTRESIIKLIELIDLFTKVAKFIDDYRNLARSISSAWPELLQASSGSTEENFFLKKLSGRYNNNTDIGGFGNNVLQNLVDVTCERQVDLLNAIENVFTFDKSLLHDVSQLLLGREPPRSKYNLESINIKEINNADLCNLLIKLVDSMDNNIVKHQSCACTTSQMMLEEFKVFINLIKSYSSQNDRFISTFVKTVSPYLHEVNRQRPKPLLIDASTVFILIESLNAQVTAQSLGQSKVMLDEFVKATKAQLKACGRESDIERIEMAQQRMKDYTGQVISLSACKPSKDESKK